MSERTVILGVILQQMATEALGRAADALTVVFEVRTPPADVDTWTINTR